MVSILVIDDDPIIRTFLSRSLQNEGYEVIVATNGRDGIEQAMRNPPAIIISDWLMPELNGLEVCRAIKANRALEQAYFMMLTSRTQLSDRIIGLDAGADDFLSKPVDICELKARIRAGLRLYQSNQALQMLAQDLQRQKQRLEAELAEAAAYVKSLLPPPMREPLLIDHLFLPSQQLGGDCFDYYWLDPDYLVIYLLDVSGHGLGSALPSVSVQNMLRSHALPDFSYYQPHTVLAALNNVFQMGEQNDRYFTMWYGVYNRQKRQLVYASAGHPPAVLLSSDGKATRLRTRGAPIGIRPDARYISEFCTIDPGSTLYIFSDGLYEVRQPNGEFWNLDGFIGLLTEVNRRSTPTLGDVLSAVQQFQLHDTFEDDCSILQVHLG